MTKKKRTTSFICYYCGHLKQAEESSDEHIVPTSIGGTRNATLTDEVCIACNKCMGKHVDSVFARDWFIEAARLLAGIKSRGKEPIHCMGVLQWNRPEHATVFATEMGVSMSLFNNTPDGKKRLFVATDESDPDVVDHTWKVIKDRFAGIPVINYASAIGKPYEEELTQSMIDLGRQLPLKSEFSVLAWHRELVKIALGLTCKTLGTEFTTSEAATLLRRFLFEDDYVKRSEIPLRVVVGIATENVVPRITAMWHPGGDQHLFALVGEPDGLVFVANLFGKYENTILVSSKLDYQNNLPSGPLPGVAWIVDGQAKTTNGPVPLRELFKR